MVDSRRNRVLVTGKGSFIARHLIRALEGAPDLTVIAAGHGEAETAVAEGGFDVLVNCALHPGLKREPYDRAKDMDLRLGSALGDRYRTGDGHMILLSSRKVYGPDNCWPARESGPAVGADSYGRNKARTEEALRERLGKRLTVLRLANVAGFEYPEPGRRSFMAMVLGRLKREGIIHYDMDPAQERDFVPLERTVDLIVAAIRARIDGTFNGGSGIALATGDLADWIMAGFGSGRLSVEDRGVDDRFVLDMTRTHAAFPHLPPLTRDDLERHFTGIGRQLHSAPFTER